MSETIASAFVETDTEGMSTTIETLPYIAANLCASRMNCRRLAPSMSAFAKKDLKSGSPERLP